MKVKVDKTLAASKTTTKPGTLDHAQIEQIRTHLAELRKELNKNR